MFVRIVLKGVLDCVVCCSALRCDALKLHVMLCCATFLWNSRQGTVQVLSAVAGPCISWLYIGCEYVDSLELL